MVPTAFIDGDQRGSHASSEASRNNAIQLPAARLSGEMHAGRKGQGPTEGVRLPAKVVSSAIGGVFTSFGKGGN